MNEADRLKQALAAADEMVRRQADEIDTLRDKLARAMNERLLELLEAVLSVAKALEWQEHTTHEGETAYCCRICHARSWLKDRRDHEPDCAMIRLIDLLDSVRKDERLAND